jgi:hypothetical protein
MQDKEYKAILDNKDRVVLHLNQPEQVLLDNFYSSYVQRLKNQLVYENINKHGIDVSYLLRGQIIAMEYVLTMKKSFDEVEALKKRIDEAKKGVR